MSTEGWIFNFDPKNLPTFSLKCLEEEPLMVSYQNEVQLMVDLDQFASIKNLSERKLDQRDICDLGFKKHQSIHTSEKSHERDFWGKTFTQGSTLKKHRRIHTGEKPYACEFCEKRFTRKDHLVGHRRMHTGEKPYACEFCEKSFSKSTSLTTHRRIHTGEKPYECDLCENRFSDPNNFRKHKKKHDKMF